MIAGIDFSTKAVDVVLLDEDTDAATWHRYELVGHDAFQRSRCVRESMPGPHAAFWDDVLAVGIEQPQMRGSGMASAYSLYRVQGAVLACIPHGTLVQPLYPSEWRKQVGLPGNASKAAIMAYVDEAMADSASMFRRWPQDACDAYCIALATRQRLEIGAAA